MLFVKKSNTYNNILEYFTNATFFFFIFQSGFIYIKPFPQLCLAVTEVKIETKLTGKETRVTGYAVALQKKMIGNPHQLWTFNPDATVASKVIGLQITY
jgi:hypothetical protein